MSDSPHDAFFPENSETGNSSENSNPRAPQLRPFHFKPGQSGNPKGRPKRGPLSDSIARMLELQVPKEMIEKANLKRSKALPKKATFADLIVFAMVQQALKGNVGAFKEMLNRSEGKTPQHLTLSSTDKLDQLMDAITAGGLPPVPDPEEADG